MTTPDITDRLAAALADAAGLGDCRQVPHETRVDRWRALLAEHADRSTAEGWEREADRLDEAERAALAVLCDPQTGPMLDRAVGITGNACCGGNGAEASCEVCRP